LTLQRFSSRTHRLDQSFLAEQLQADFPLMESPKSPATTGLVGNFGFHVDGYMVTCRRSSICSCSGVGVLF